MEKCLDLKSHLSMTSIRNFRDEVPQNLFINMAHHCSYFMEGVYRSHKQTQTCESYVYLFLKKKTKLNKFCFML